MTHPKFKSKRLLNDIYKPKGYVDQLNRELFMLNCLSVLWFIVTVFVVVSIVISLLT